MGRGSSIVGAEERRWGVLRRWRGPGRLTITTKNKHLKPTQPAAEPERTGPQGAGSDSEESRLREKSMATPRSGGERGDNKGQNFVFVFAFALAASCASGSRKKITYHWQAVTVRHGNIESMTKTITKNNSEISFHSSTDAIKC